MHRYYHEIVGSSVTIDLKTGQVIDVRLGGPHITREDVLADLGAAWPGFGQDLVNKSKGLPGMFDLPKALGASAARKQQELAARLFNEGESTSG